LPNQRNNHRLPHNPLSNPHTPLLHIFDSKGMIGSKTEDLKPYFSNFEERSFSRHAATMAGGPTWQ